MSLASVVGGSKDEFVTSLAALALYDGGAEITADNIKALLDASNNTVQPYWPSLFASLLKDGKIEALVFSTGAPAASAGAAVAAAGGDAGALPVDDLARAQVRCAFSFFENVC